MRRTVPIILFLVTAGVAAAWISSRSARRVAGPKRRVIEVRGGEVRIQAIARPGHFSRWFFQPGHHAIVWSRGRSRFGALFESAASDLEVRAALRALGARPGENLSAKTWDARKNPRSTEPDKRVEGTPIDVFVEWNGSGGPVPLSHLILENGRAADFDLRFGGNERFRPHFKSGCIVCDYSCPGGAIGNRNRTIREEVRLGPIFKINEARVPAEGTAVTITLRPHQAGPTRAGRADGG